MKDHPLFREDRSGEHCGGAALCMRQCTELCLEVKDEHVESL